MLGSESGPGPLRGYRNVYDAERIKEEEYRDEGVFYLVKWKVSVGAIGY